MLGSGRALPVVCSRAAGLDCADVGRHQLRLLGTLSATTLTAGATGADGRRASPTALGRWLASAAAAGAAAIVGVTFAIAGGSIYVQSEAPSSTSFGGESVEAQAAAEQLHDWLSRHGADVSKVQVKPSQAAPGAGLGLYARVAASSARPGPPWWSWLWPRRGGSAAPGQREPTTLAAFPLSAAITVRTVCQDPQLGDTFSWMLDKQMLDERTAVMVYLLIERLRGDRSRYAPWIACLPRSFDVPIAYSESELLELRGTALHGATAAMAKRMRETWSRLEGPLGRVAREVGLPAPRWEDWVWAYCVFWSRGQSLPVPEKGAASSALASSLVNGQGEKIPIQILEGLVPGLDFCNHRHEPPPQCWWEVIVPERPKAAVQGNGDAMASASGRAGTGAAVNAAATSAAASTATVGSSSGAAGSDGPVVRLQLHAGGKVRAGEELYISYGDKSNEELLMLYGFALERNPLDRLMLYCPLPPQSEWDDVMRARVSLLQAYGLRPQFFLPYPERVEALEGSGQPMQKGRNSSSQKAAPSATTAAATATGSDEGGADSDAPDAPPLGLPSDVLDTLEVFVLNFQELAVRSKALQAAMDERRANRAAGAPPPALTSHSPVLDLASLRSRYQRMTPAELRHYLHTLGLRMATLTTFIRLLEIKVTDLEGPEGTGSLEADEQLIASLDQQARRLRAAVVYRMGQKRLARSWLVRAKGELKNLLALMRDMQARQETEERRSK